jgi:hypothetical protein
MPKQIKTKHTVKDIKLLDKAASGTAHVKNAFVKSKDEAVGTQQTTHDNAETYASDKMSGGAKSAAQEAANRFKHPQNKVKQNVDKAKEHFAEAKRNLPKQRKAAAEQAKKTAETAKSNADKLGKTADQAKKAAEEAQKSVIEAKRTLGQTRQAGRQTVQAVKQAGKTTRQAGKTIKTTSKAAKSTAKGTIKTVKKSVKTAERTAKTTVKTAKATAKAAQKSAQAAAKAAKLAAQAAKVAAKTAVQAAKVAVKATIAMVKAAIAAIKGLVALIAAGGWVAVLVIVIICLIGLLVGSIFGIFFSGEDSGSGYTMPMAIAEINTEYADKLTEIRNSNTHDEVSMSGTRAEWKAVLAVYAVKINSDPDNPADVATMDESKKALLSSVFWDMNILTSRTETREVTEVTVEGDGNEDFTSTETTVTKTILYITVTHKTADEMAAQYGFSEQQKAQLAELLSEEYASLWSAVLYGIHSGSEDIVAVAISQLGNVNGEPYWSWYGFNDRVAWCAIFVSWCANECGYLDAGIIPRFAACERQGIVWFTERGLYQTDDGYIPKPGDIIFFDWEQDGHSDHVGIVEYVEGEVVHTVEGNTTNSVARRSYRLDDPDVIGFGCPLY